MRVMMQARRAMHGMALIALPFAFAAAQAPRAEILVLGSFHMDSPGRDLFNTQVDDVLSPKRQEEMAQLLTVLKRFRPTKIAIEADVSGRRASQQYLDYLAGKYVLTRNEIDQIGYRLAKELGHARVYAVDESGDFPVMRVRNYATATGQSAKFDSAQAAVGRRVKAESEFLRTHTLLDMLQLVNADSTAERAVGEYYSGLLPFGEPYEYAGPDLLASWYQRNIRIYLNIRRLIESPADRILVIYGSGHLGWLRQNVANDPIVRLRKLSELTVPARP
jgi:hypothetical protein